VSEPIVIGLGGNVGTERELAQRFARAREAIEQLGPVRSAPLYRCAPIGPAQPPFLNTAVALRLVDGQPAELIATLLELERMLGRARGRETRWGPRPIDLDVLVWGQRVIATPELTVPHPRLAERRFALEPVVVLLGEDFEIAGVGRAGSLLARVTAQQVTEIAPAWPDSSGV
jgi:2-amino-4-hydroxy-6-hydroxymethyldihydropteridine diphosphokinase